MKGKKGKGYKEGCCEEKWKYFKDKDGPNLKTLEQWVQDDKPIECDFI